MVPGSALEGFAAVEQQAVERERVGGHRAAVGSEW